MEPLPDQSASQHAYSTTKAYQATFRDRIASSLANGVLIVFGTRAYRDALNAVIRAGLRSAYKVGPNPPFNEPLDDPRASDQEGHDA